MTKNDDIGWIDAVARRANVEPTTAERILEAAAIRPSPYLPRPRALKLVNVSFSGRKCVADRDTTFSFVWPLDVGVNCIASHGNLVGKSSVLRVVLWALRGEPKNLQADVRGWIREVDVSFEIDGVGHRVIFSTQNGEVRGDVRRQSGGSLRPIATFTNTREFATCMNEIMCDALGLEHLPSWQSFAGSDDGHVILNGWPAYCGALVIADASHKVLLGETEHAGLPGRLLQMFMGLPWATTLAAAKAKEREVSQHAANTARRLTQDAEARSQEEAGLRAQIDAARLALSKLPDEGASIASVESAYKEVASAQEDAFAVERAFEAAHIDAEAARSQRLEDQARLQDAEEARMARRFFDGLDPSCCPRCDAKIDAERRKREKSAATCAVCSSPLGVPVSDESMIAQLRDVLRASTEAEFAAKSRYQQAQERRVLMKGALDTARAALAAARLNAEVFADRRKAELDLARLEGALEERIRTRHAAEGALAGELDSETSAVVQAAAQEADARAKAAAGDIFSALNEEVCRLARDFGISAISSVRLDRAARLAVTKNGNSTSFSYLTPGERLRLRVATVAGLLRVAADRGVGRHPGVLLVDSPGSEEVRREDAAEFVRELATVARGIEGFQVVVATARPDVVATAIPGDRIRLVAPGQFAW